MIIRFATDVKTAMLTPLKDQIDVGGAAGYVEFYTGTIPTTPATAVTTQTKLGTVAFAYPMGSVASGVLTAGAFVQDSSADASGTAAWARVYSSTGVVKFDLDVSGLAGSGAIKLNTTAISAFGPINITSMTITLP